MKPTFLIPTLLLVSLGLALVLHRQLLKVKAEITQTSAMKQEWLSRLTAMLGPQRAEMLRDAFYRNSRTGTSSPGTRYLGLFVDMLQSSNRDQLNQVNWLVDGSNQVDISISFRRTPDGSLATTTRIQGVGSAARINGGQSGGTHTGAWVDPRLRHLLTLEMLGMQ